jgi:hypothetical protein
MAGNTSFESGDMAASRSQAGAAIRVVADPHSRPTIAVHWIKNSVLAAILGAVTSLLMYGLRSAAGATAADAGFGAMLISCVAAIGLWALWGAASAVLTGAVLQRVIPWLPVRAWIGLHLAMAATGGGGSEIALNALPDTSDTPATDDAPMAAMLVVGFFLGVIAGSLAGGLEALVLRRAASGTAAWIMCSIASFAIAMSIAAGGGMMLSDAGNGFVRELAVQAVAFLALVLVSPIMLPALRRLRSRTLPAAAWSSV